MIRFLVRTALTLIANAVGLIVASLLLPGFHIDAFGFILSVIIFTVISIVIEPFMQSVAEKYANALRGGTALATTLVGLILTVMMTSGLRIEGLSTWIIAPIIIWLAVVLANIVLPLFLFKKILREASERRSGRSEKSDS